MLDAAPSPLLPVLFVAVFAILTAAGYVLHFRTVGLSPPSPAALRPRSLPEERARAALSAGAPLAEIDVRAYYGCIAAAIRAYLDERFGISSTAMVRSDVEKAMAEADIDGRAAALAAGLLDACDAAQFGGLVPDSARRTADLAAAQEIIELTAAGTAQIAPPRSDASRPTSV